LSQSKKYLDNEYQSDYPSTQSKKCNGVLLSETPRGGLMKSGWGTKLVCTAWIWIALIISPRVFGQTINATLLGTATDSSGAVVVGAKVTATEMKTGVNRSTATNDSGNYEFADLSFGNYEAAAEKHAEPPLYGIRHSTMPYFMGRS